MREGRRIAGIMALVMTVTTLGTDISYGAEAFWQNSVYNDGSTVSGAETSPTEVLTPVLTGLRAIYDESSGQIHLTFQKTNCAYVDIRVNGELIEEDWRSDSYIYEIPEDGQQYRFEVIPYNEDDVAGTAVAESVMVPYRKAVLSSVEAEYDLENRILVVSWEGSNIASVAIYKDAQTTPVVQEAEDDDVYVEKTALEPNSRHTYRVVAYNREKEAGDSKTVELKVGDYTPCVEDVSAWYDEETRRIEVSWDDKYTLYADVLLNDVLIAKKCTQKSISFPCELQPGADYKITVVPYDAKNEEGEEGTDSVSYGLFETPETPDVKLSNQPAYDAAHNYTGFYKPAAQLEFQAQRNGVYEIYRATKDTKRAYNWIGTIKAEADGICTYQDTGISVGTYYYKVRRTIVQDKYIEDDLYSGLSDAAEAAVVLPRAHVNAELTEADTVQLTMKSDSDLVSGYTIYKKNKNGKYKKIADVVGNEYEDIEISFGKNYCYKVRAYYYDVKTGKKYLGEYSAACNVKNLVGNMQVSITPVSEKQVKLSWTKAANAEGYEVYYKTAVKGDSYELFTSTTKQSVKPILKNGKKYFFLIKAYRQNSEGKVYFSSAAISFQTGFASPQDLRVSKTTYKLNEKTGTLTQKSQLRWKRVYGADGYLVQRYNTKSKKYEEVADLTDEEDTSYTVSDLVTAVESETGYRVCAYIGDKKAASQPVQVMIKLKQPSKIGLKGSGAKLKLTWNKVTGAAAYRIYRSVGRTMVYIGETSKTTYEDNGLEAGVPSRYYVQAVNEKNYCASDYGVSEIYTLRPAKVKGLTGKRRSSQAVLKWKGSTFAGTYVIYVSTDGKNYKKLAEVKKGTLQYTHKKLKAGTGYYYRVTVKKVNSAGITAEAKAAQIKL